RVWLSIVLTFLFVNFAWVFFRAPSSDTALSMTGRMMILHSGVPGFSLVSDYYSLPVWIAAIILLFRKNTNELAEEFTYNAKFAFVFIGLVLLNLLFLNSVANQEFLYFDF